MSVIGYLLLSSPLKVLYCLHRVLNSHAFCMSLDVTNAFIHCSMCPWGNLRFEILGIINLMSSATIFTSSHIAILLLSLHFLAEPILQLCCYYCFSLALLIIGSHIVLISMLSRLRRFFWPRICADSLCLRIFQWCSLSMISTWSHRRWWSPFLSICSQPRLIFPLP